MAGPLARLYATLGLDTTGFDKGVAKAQTTTQKWGSALASGFGLGAGVGVFNLATQGIGMAVDALGDAVDMASDLAEQQGKVEVVFADSADTVLAWGETTADALGMSERAALTAAGTFGGLFQTLGIGGDETAKPLMDLVTLASDLGAFFNVAESDALAALRSGLVGESEPMRQFNVLLSAAAVNERALRLGLAKTTREITEQDKVMARMDLIFEQTTAAQGNFQDTQDGLAGSTKTLNAQLEDATTNIGEKLIPSMLALTKAANDYLVPALDAVAESVGFITGQGEGGALTLQEIVDKQLGAVPTAFQRLRGGLTSAATPDAFGLLGFGESIGTAIADAADKLNAPFATFAKEAPEAVEQTFADIRAEIKAGFGSVKQALQGPSGIIDPAKRMENMGNRLRAASAKLAEARQVGDTFGIAKWEAAVEKQRINLREYRRSVSENTDGIIRDARHDIIDFTRIGREQGAAQGRAYRRALVDQMARAVNNVIQTIGQTMAMQIINIGNVYGGPTGERELANRLSRAERLARRDRG